MVAWTLRVVNASANVGPAVVVTPLYNVSWAPLFQDQEQSLESVFDVCAIKKDSYQLLLNLKGKPLKIVFRTSPPSLAFRSQLRV